MRETGVVIRIIHNRGFGFIRGENDNVSRFFNAKWVKPEIDFDTMHEGQRVTFVPDNNGRAGNGAQALEVRKVKP